MGTLTTQRTINRIFKGAMQIAPPTRCLASFRTASRLMAEAGLPSDIFSYTKPLRRITFNKLVGEQFIYLGVYFGTRLEVVFENVDWLTYGWDGDPRMIIFHGGNPPVWVILHEFAHYLDDTFIRAVHDFKDIGLGRMSKFVELRQDMREEFENIQRKVKLIVNKTHGDIFDSPSWWDKIPHPTVDRYLPTAYACANFSEWFAEWFQTWCIWRDASSLSEKAPATMAFMEFLFSRKIFEKVREQTSVPNRESVLSQV